MANKYRGEVQVTLGKKSYPMRPTFEALCEIETKTGRGIVPLTRAVSQGDIGVRDMATIVCAGVNAAGSRYDAADIGKMIVDAGVVSIIPSVVEFLSGALTGGTQENPPPGEAQGKTPSPGEHSSE